VFVVVVVVDSSSSSGGGGGGGVVASRVLGGAALAARRRLAAGVEGADGLGLVGLALPVQQLVQDLRGESRGGRVKRSSRDNKRDKETGMHTTTQEPDNRDECDYFNYPS